MNLKGLLILPLLVASLQAASVSDLTFTLNDDGNEYGVTNFDSSASGSLDIPIIYNGLPVTSIGDWAFTWSSSITSIKIPDSVNSIGTSAFKGCTGLTSITIPDSVTSIKEEAFRNCSSLQSIIFKGDAPLQIGESVFLNTHSSLYIKIEPDATGFSLPTWQGINTGYGTKRIYVNANAAAGGDGTSWETAFNYLQDALDVTVSGRGDQIWIARGTYYPDDGTSVTEGDRFASFMIKDQVSLYGGFIGSETDSAQRDWESYPTILSGEIVELSDDWSFHVTTIDSNHVSFDGITITKGNANRILGDATNRGAAVYGRGNVTAINCTFTGNSAEDYGGVASQSTWTATNCTFTGNSAKSGGVSYGGTWTTTNCTFTGNSADDFGGVAYFGFWTAINCAFDGNSARIGGVVSDPNIRWITTNCTFTRNSANRSGGVAYNGFWTATNCTFAGNSADVHGGVAYAGYWTILDSIFYDNSGRSQFDSSTIYVSSGFESSTNYVSSFNPYLYKVSNNLIHGENDPFHGTTIPHYYAVEANFISADPLFVDAADPDGPDDIWGTADDGLRLTTSSPVIGLGDTDYLPVDTYDLDGDGNTTESLPVDIAGYYRVQDASLDLGAYEYGNAIVTTTYAKIGSDGTGTVNGYYIGPSANLTDSNLAGVAFTNANLFAANLSGADLSYADLSKTILTGVISGSITGTPTLPSGYQMISGYIVGPKVDLSGANLTESNLTGADLSGANLTNANLSGANLTGADLSDAGLSDADLTGANLTGANLTNTDLSGTDLTNANLTNTNLVFADLSYADLSRAILTGVISGSITGTPTLPSGYQMTYKYIVGPGVHLANADLSGTDLTDADLTDADLSGADLERANLTGADLSRAILTGVISGSITGTPTLPSGYQMTHEYIIGPGVHLTNADLTGANLINANLSGADLSGAYLERANLTGADLTGADLTGAYLNFTDLAGANLVFADLTGADLLGANLTYANLSGADLSGAYLERANLTGADLTGADLTGADLTGADLSGAYLGSANLTHTTLTGADLTGAYLSGADLSGANLNFTDLAGVDFSNTIWSNVVSWSDYDAVVAERNARPTQAAYDAVVSESNAKLTLDEVKDLRAGSTMIEIQDGQATLSMEVEQSDDLAIWTSGGTTNLQIPVDANSNTKFFRFKMTE